jgi:hypothetical protein
VAAALVATTSCFKLGLSVRPDRDADGEGDAGADTAADALDDADAERETDGDVDAAPDADALGDGEGDVDRPDADGLPPDWHDVGWRSRVTLAIDNRRHGTDLVDFPLLVVLEPATFEYARARADGRDILFVDRDTDLPLPHEIESWQQGGTSHFWVLVPLIAAGVVSEDVVLYYENATAVVREDPEAVWRGGYAAVYHLHDDLADSTGIGADGTSSGSTTTAGQVAGGRHFTYAGAEHIVIDDAGLPFGSTPRTLCAWVRTDVLDSPTKHWFISYGTFVTRGGFFIGRVGTDLWCGGVGDDVIATGIYALATWQYLCCALEGNEVTLYADGTLVEGPATRTWTLDPGEAYIGGHINPDWVEQWDGNVDEVRISSVARSEDWISAEHLSMTTGFASLGPVEHL